MSLPKFKAYEESLPMNDGLEKALLDVYVEIICFCARTIRFFRSNPHREYIYFCSQLVNYWLSSS